MKVDFDIGVTSFRGTGFDDRGANRTQLLLGSSVFSVTSVVNH